VPSCKSAASRDQLPLHPFRFVTIGSRGDDPASEAIVMLMRTSAVPSY
jgi:hypothetical protein